MKALILAGGFARRLAPLTDFVSKPLLPLGEKLVIDWVLDNLKTIPIDEIVVSTNRYYEKQFRYWARCRDENIRLIIEPTRGEEEKFGAIAGIKYAMDIVGEDEYIVVAGDNVFDFSMYEFYEFYKKIQGPVLAVYDVESIELAKRYGVVTVDEDMKIVNMQEKPDEPESTLISTACYMFPNGIKTMLDEYLSEKKNPDSPGYFLAWLANKRAVYAYSFTGLWKDIGNLDEYKEVFNRFL